MAQPAQYDERYLAGIVLFNQGDFFEAHEAWEELWMDNAGEERRFVQSLIQAAVAILHFCNGNVRGARKLHKSSRDYMQPYESPYWGLDIHEFWRQMDACFAELLSHPEPDQRIQPDENLLPVIELNDPPDAWPDVSRFFEGE